MLVKIKNLEYWSVFKLNIQNINVVKLYFLPVTTTSCNKLTSRIFLPLAVITCIYTKFEICNIIKLLSKYGNVEV